jgi:hypothetical protein
MAAKRSKTTDLLAHDAQRASLRFQAWRRIGSGYEW